MNTTSEQKRWLTIAQVAAETERSISTITRWKNAGRIRAFRIGGRVVFDREEIRRLQLPVPIVREK